MFDIQTDEQMVNWFGPDLTFNNQGSLRKSAGSGATLLGVDFRNTGMVEVQSGTLSFSNFRQISGSTLLNGGSVRATSGTLLVQGGVLGGFGPVVEDLAMSGQLSPGISPGRLTVQGNYDQRSSGSYNCEIGGTIAGTNYDQVVITGNATLAGTINVVSINGFTPAPGDRFEIMKFASRSGSVTFQGLDIANGITLVPEVSSSNIILVATSVPLSPSPRLNVFRNGDALWVSWPHGYPGFQLHSATNLAAPIQWSPVPLSEPNRAILAPSGPATFFRLVSP